MKSTGAFEYRRLVLMSYYFACLMRRLYLSRECRSRHYRSREVMSIRHSFQFRPAHVASPSLPPSFSLSLAGRRRLARLFSSREVGSYGAARALTSSIGTF